MADSPSTCNRSGGESQALPADEPPARAQPESVLSVLRQPDHAALLPGSAVDPLPGPCAHLLVSGTPSCPQHLSFIIKSLKDAGDSSLVLVSPAAGSVHLSDLLHRRGRRASDATAQQLPPQPRPVQPRRVRLQRRDAAQQRRRAPPLVGCATVFYASLWRSRKNTARTVDPPEEFSFPVIVFGFRGGEDDFIFFATNCAGVKKTKTDCEIEYCKTTSLNGINLMERRRLPHKHLISGQTGIDLTMYLP